MKQVIAMHGWAGDSNTWSLWASEFQKTNWLWQSVERGYGDITPFHPNWIITEEIKNHQRRVVIAHSLGPHLIPETILKYATDIVFLCSFSRFIPTSDRNRSVKTALQGMYKSLGTDNEEKMLINFLKKACAPESLHEVRPGPITKGLSLEGRKKLKSDLQLLIQTKGLPNGIATKCRVLIIQGAKDSIIVPESRSYLKEDLTNHLDNPPSYWEIPEAGHLLLMPMLIKRVQTWLNTHP